MVGAGSILRDDVPEDDQLVLPAPPATRQRPVTPNSYSKLNRIIAHNVSYLAICLLLRPGTDRFVVSSCPVIASPD
ncbi:N-acetylglucosamine-1-phosphate uridyltransferase [Cutibacterium acnes JCM 18920]|nr:N-acetylglucosamine-1-phosphate uridyltransferase [Cutibacterium acnes JCM 18920]